MSDGLSWAHEQEERRAKREQEERERRTKCEGRVVKYPQMQIKREKKVIARSEDGRFVGVQTNDGRISTAFYHCGDEKRSMAFDSYADARKFHEHLGTFLTVLEGESE